MGQAALKSEAPAAPERRGAKKQKPKIKPPHPADDLSFMARRKPKGTGIHYWLVTPSGDRSQDWETGRDLAEEYLAYIGKHPTIGNELLLGDIVHDMFEQARAGQSWNAINGGFLRRVNIYAMASARLVAAGARMGRQDAAGKRLAKLASAINMEAA